MSSMARPSERASRIRSQMAACAPTSTPRVGWAATSTLGPASSSRPTISFCWLPPDRAPASVSGPGARTSYSRMIRAGVVPREPAPQEAAAEQGVLTTGGRARGSPTGAREQQRLAVPVLGHERDAVRAAPLGGPALMSSPSSVTEPAVGVDQAEEHLDQLDLAVALDAGDADHLAAVQLEADVVEHRGPLGPDGGDAVDAELDVVGDGGLAGLGRRAARCRPSARRAAGPSPPWGRPCRRSCRAG